MAYSQHQSQYNAFFSIRKTWAEPKDGNQQVHFFSKESLPGIQTTTRFYKNRNGEWLQLTGSFIDSLDDVTIAGVSVAEPKELDNGTKIPEQIVVDVQAPVAGKIDRIQFASDSKWGNDFARKSIKLDFTQPVTLRPYTITQDNGSLTEGISITQNGEKVTDPYVERIKEGDKTVIKNINGVEDFDKLADEAKAEKNDKLRSNAWKTYFTKVNVFVVEKMKEHVATAEFVKVSAPVAKPDYPEDEINPDEVPF